MKKSCFLITILLLILLSIQVGAAQPLADGQYTVEVVLSGGSGRAQVQSPTELRVTEGKATAVIRWSSPYYEFMMVDGTKYLPINTEGNAAFQIPVIFDEEMPVSAQTVAMSTPHIIDYTLRFVLHSLKPVGQKANLIPYGIGAGILLLVVCSFVVYKQKAAVKQQGKGN